MVAHPYKRGQRTTESIVHDENFSNAATARMPFHALTTFGAVVRGRSGGIAAGSWDHGSEEDQAIMHWAAAETCRAFFAVAIGRVAVRGRLKRHFSGIESS